MIENRQPVITIDGASGVGKGTVSQLLAKHLGWHFLDSGALYRVLALAAQKHSVVLDNEAALEVLAEHLDVQFLTQDNNPQVILEGENVTQVIRTEKIGNAASMISVLPAVRAALLSRQRAFRATPGLIAEGRDMGTVVFPDAELKIFLQASLEERALRRYGQLKSKGLDVTLSAIMEDLCMRDKRDQERAVAPLKPAIGAVCINTDHLSIEQVIEKVLLEIKRKKAFPAISNLMTGSARVGVAE
jgi:cytidylate kinase